MRFFKRISKFLKIPPKAPPDGKEDETLSGVFLNILKSKKHKIDLNKQTKVSIFTFKGLFKGRVS
jgi:hypothetical protein